MTNGNQIQNFNGKCPIHSTEIKKEYEFGIYRDATVMTFNGCKCALCFANNGFNDDPQYYTSYNQAAGRAKMINAQASAW